MTSADLQCCFKALVKLQGRREKSEQQTAVASISNTYIYKLDNHLRAYKSLLRLSLGSRKECCKYRGKLLFLK